MLLEQSVTDPVDLLVHLENLAGTLQIERGESLVNQVQHFAQDGRHFNKLARIGSRNLRVPGLYPHSYAPHQIADPLEIRRALQAGEQLPGASFVPSRDGRRQPLIDLTLDEIKLLLAILNR